MAITAQLMFREVMDVRQAADYLGITGDTLYRYASEGFVPAFKLGNRWRFKKDVLDAWMEEMSGVKAAGTATVTVGPSASTHGTMETPESEATVAERRKPVRRAR